MFMSGSRRETSLPRRKDNSISLDPYLTLSEFIAIIIIPLDVRPNIALEIGRNFERIFGGILIVSQTEVCWGGNEINIFRRRANMNNI